MIIISDGGESWQEVREGGKSPNSIKSIFPELIILGLSQMNVKGSYEASYLT